MDGWGGGGGTILKSGFGVDDVLGRELDLSEDFFGFGAALLTFNGGVGLGSAGRGRVGREMMSFLEPEGLSVERSSEDERFLELEPFSFTGLVLARGHSSRGLDA